MQRSSNTKGGEEFSVGLQFWVLLHILGWKAGRLQRNPSQPRIEVREYFWLILLPSMMLVSLTYPVVIWETIGWLRPKWPVTGKEGQRASDWWVTEAMTEATTKADAPRKWWTWWTRSCSAPCRALSPPCLLLPPSTAHRSVHLLLRKGCGLFENYNFFWLKFSQVFFLNKNYPLLIVVNFKNTKINRKKI